MSSDNLNGRPAIGYPTAWEYKVIGRDEDELSRAVADCIAQWSPAGEPERPWDLTWSRASKGGQYVSLTLVLEVRSEVERDALFQALSMRPEIRLVI
jgi:putative lipoic acid-binding regulatory protein